jgi:hypothetical protein
MGNKSEIKLFQLFEMKGLVEPSNNLTERIKINTYVKAEFSFNRFIRLQKPFIFFSLLIVLINISLLFLPDSSKNNPKYVLYLEKIGDFISKIELGRQLSDSIIKLYPITLTFSIVLILYFLLLLCVNERHLKPLERRC